MTDVNLSPKARSLIDRAKGVLLSPRTEWDEIAGEAATLQGLFTGYVVIMAAIPAVAMTVGLAAFGWYGLPVGIGPAISAGVSCYITSLVAVALLGFAIEFLGPQFGAPKERVPAFKLAVYSMTPVWVAGVLFLLPGLGGLVGLAALYAAYILYLGLPKLAPAPADKAQTWTIVAVICALVATGLVVGSGQASRVWRVYADNTPVTGTIRVPGYGSVNVEKAEAASTAANAAIASALGQGAQAAVKPVGAEALSALLPARIGGFSRGQVQQVSSSAGGLTTVVAKAAYTAGEGSIALSVTDMGGAAAFAQLASAFDVNSSERKGERYERMAKVDGRLTIEKYDAASRSGEYTVVVAERFMVEASGTNVDMTTLKNAVNSVGFARLEALARA